MTFYSSQEGYTSAWKIMEGRRYCCEGFGDQMGKAKQSTVCNSLPEDTKLMQSKTAHSKICSCESLDNVSIIAVEKLTCISYYGKSVV